MRARWLFFSLFCVLAIPGRFMPIFYSAHEQNDVQMGILMGSAPLISMVASPLLCNLADRLRRRELVAAVSYILAMLCFLLQIIAQPSLHLLTPEARFPTLLALRVAFGFFSAGAYPLVSAISMHSSGRSTVRRGVNGSGRKGFGVQSVGLCARWHWESCLTCPTCTSGLCISESFCSGLSLL